MVFLICPVHLFHSLQAPEILVINEVGREPADIFACGVILFIIISGNRCFESSSKSDPYYRQLWKGDSDKFWEALEKKQKIKADGANFYSEEFRDLINGMFQPDPSKRFTVTQVKEHIWYKGRTMTKIERKQEFELCRKTIDSFLERDKQNKREAKLHKAQEAEDFKRNPHRTFTGFSQCRCCRGVIKLIKYKLLRNALREMSLTKC